MSNLKLLSSPRFRYPPLPRIVSGPFGNVKQKWLHSDGLVRLHAVPTIQVLGLARGAPARPDRHRNSPSTKHPTGRPRPGAFSPMDHGSRLAVEVLAAPAAEVPWPSSSPIVQCQFRRLSRKLRRRSAIGQ